MTAIYSQDGFLAKPRVHLNPVSLDHGELLVMVEIGENGTYMTFTSLKQLEPYAIAFAKAVDLAREGAGVLAERELAKAAEQARAAEAEDDAAVMDAPVYGLATGANEPVLPVAPETPVLPDSTGQLMDTL